MNFQGCFDRNAFTLDVPGSFFSFIGDSENGEKLSQALVESQDFFVNML